jgi:hypothetical protein
MSDEVKLLLRRIATEELIGGAAPSISLAGFEAYANGLSNSTLCALFNEVLEAQASDFRVEVKEPYWSARDIYNGILLSLVRPDCTFWLFTITCFSPALSWVEACEGEKLELRRQRYEDHQREEELAALAAQDLADLLKLALKRLESLAGTTRLSERDRRVVALLASKQHRDPAIAVLSLIIYLSMALG